MQFLVKSTSILESEKAGSIQNGYSECGTDAGVMSLTLVYRTIRMKVDNEKVEMDKHRRFIGHKEK